MTSNNEDVSNNTFDVVMLATQKNLSVLKESISFVKDNLGSKSIYVIASKEIKKDLELMGLLFIDEDSVMEGLSLHSVKEQIIHRELDPDRAGWYFQQFLKYAYAFYTHRQYYLTWDADTIPLNRIDFFYMNKPRFVEKVEYHAEYFETIKILTNNQIYRCDPKISYIAENMLFNSQIVKEIIELIESNQGIPGKLFFEKIINTVNPAGFQSGFSEFEMYGNYVRIRHPELYDSLKLRTLRNGSFFVGQSPTREQLTWAQKDFDIISLEGREMFIVKLSKHGMFRKVFSLRLVSRIVLFIRSLRRTILGMEKLDYDL